MLSRGNSNAATRLRRAKSASSVQSYRPASSDTTTVDPETAYQHALAAASVAFEQAHGRDLKTRTAGEDADVASNDRKGRALKHRQSIRFTGPSAMSANPKSITRNQATDYDRFKSSSHAQRSRQEPSLRTSDSFVTALPEQSEEYIERRVSSLPSSYRRLRKTKSMVNPSKGSSSSLVNGFSRGRGHARTHSLRPQNRESGQRASQDSRLRKSLSFLRQPATSPEPPRKSIDQDKAVQLARDQFVRQLEQQRVKEKTSIVDFAQQRKSGKPFRRTVRTSSTNSYGSAIASPAAAKLEIPKGSGLGRKARSISISLKSRLKKVFHKPSDVEEIVPVQQLNASRPHFGDFMSSFNGTQQRYDHHIPSPDGHTLQSIDSRGSTSRETSAFVEKPSHPASIRSIESTGSVEKETSRVSSWETSTIANSLATLQSRENKRLSTINEGAPYQPSSVRPYGNLGYNFAASTDPIRDYSAGSLYSRLRREIEKNERMARQHEKTEESDTIRHIPDYIADLTPRGSSLGIPGHGGLRMSKSVVFNPPSTEIENRFEASQLNQFKVHNQLGHHSNSSSQDLSEHKGISNSPSKQPLREVKSAFFPPSIRLERNAPSPYRQVTRDNSEDKSTPQKQLGTVNTSKTSQAPNEQSPFLQVRNFTDSDSIYSRTTSGNTPRASDSPSTNPDSGDEPGTAIIASKPLRYNQSSPSRRQNTSSVQSSGEWKTWLSTEVAQLEKRTTTAGQSQGPPSASTRGHKRENAQMNEDDVEIGKLRRVNDMPVQPIAEQQSHPQSRPGLVRQDTSDSTVERYALLEIETPHINSQSNQPCSETPQPMHSQNQSEVDKESPRSIRTLKSAGELRPKPSQASLKSRSSKSPAQKRYGMSLTTSHSGSSDTLRTPSPRSILPKESPAARHSADRQARLRRMQSSTSLESRRNQENRPFGSGETPGSGDAQPKSARPPLAASRSAGSVNGKDGSQDMIDRFLSNRRRDMRISEESGGDPAFL